MPINTTCPACRQRFLQLKDALRGQAIVCPNVDCRRVFTVVEDAPPACDTSGPKTPPPSGKERRSRTGSGKSGSVGDMVPILPAEITLSPDPEPAPVAKKQTTGSVGDMIPLLQPDPDPGAVSPAVSTSWMEPPPVRRPPAAGTSAPSAGAGQTQ